MSRDTCATAPAAVRVSFADRNPVNPPNSAAYDAIDAYVEQQMQRLHPPGVSLSIVAGERMAHGRGYLKLYMPGYFWIVTIGGGLATVWSLLRAGSLLRLSRGSFSL